MFMVEAKGGIWGFISGVAPHSLGGEDAGGDAISLGKLIAPGFEGGQPIWRRGNEGAAASGSYCSKPKSLGAGGFGFVAELALIVNT